MFYLGSPASRPYVITDAATELRMFRKLTWFYRVFLSALIVGQAFLIPRIMHNPLRFFGFLALLIAVQWLVLRLMFFRDLRKLSRAAVRPTLKTFYANVGQRHSVKALKWGLIGSVVFVIAGVAAILEDVNQIAIGLTTVALFSVSAVAWAYSLKVKLAQKAEQAATAKN